MSVVSRIETLGFPRITPAQSSALNALLKTLPELPLTESVIGSAIALRQQRRMGLADAIIAATALVHGLPLVTRNTEDFKHVAGLRLIDPFATAPSLARDFANSPLAARRSRTRLDARRSVIQLRLTMPATASIRDLRNSFPKIRKLVEAEGEVLLSESGQTKYRLVLHTPRPAKPAPAVDYWSRLTSYQPTPLTRAQAQTLHDDNRGDR